jgi:asparagine synthase (glutamine-hydrolysing)
MPGILGIISEKSESSLFKRMIDVVNHYSYATDSYEKDGVHLGRVHLNYVNKCQQPVFSEDKRFGLVMIGEIFSYKNTETKDIVMDSSFLLNLLIDEGMKALPFINGHFSAALYDFNEKRLVLISDRYGTRPVYFALHQGKFLFAPEVKAILKDDISKELDYQAISHLMHFCHLFGHRTMFSGIQQLPESSFLVFENGDFQIHRYWDFPFHDEAYSMARLSEKKYNYYLDTLDSHITKAMERVYTKNPEEIILSLSGGLDSRFVAAYGHALNISHLKAFTFGPENCDDQLYASQVARLLSIEHKAFEVIPATLWKDAESFSYVADNMSMIYGPIQGFSVLKDYYHQGSVTISSQMADAIFGGNLWRKRIQYLFQQKSLDSNSRNIIINIFNLIDDELLREVFEQDFYKKIREGYQEIPELYIDRYKHPFFTYINLLMNEHGRRGTLCGNLMNNLFLETRMPSYDNDLMDFAYELPLPLRFYQHAYRKVFANRFPELAVINREMYKLPVNSPDILYKLKILENKIINTLKRTPVKPAIMMMGRWNKPEYMDYNGWFKHDLQHEMISFLMSEKTLSRGIFKKSGIERIIEGHRNAFTDYSKIIWQLINLEYFFRKFIDE